MIQTLNEDDIYRASSQYRLWSFSPEILASTREKTHSLAVERTRRNYETSGLKPPTQYLSQDEELRLVQRYCEQLRTTSDHLQYPPSTKATAVQFLRRFYVSNSVITYPPKEIYKTVLYLACKSEGQHVTVSSFARRISTDKEAILAPEYKIMQALRFTLEVKQPFRGLKGVLMELLNVIAGVGCSEDVKDEIFAVELPGKESKTQWKKRPSKVSADDLNERCQAAYSAARAILDAQALLTDVYFLYAPSQILLAALSIADKPLTEFYLTTKLPTALPTRPKILATISACVDILNSAADMTVMSKDERATLEEKLDTCRDPTTRDLVKIHSAAKFGGNSSDEDEEQATNGKQNRSKEKDGDVFGPSLKATGKGKT